MNGYPYNNQAVQRMAGAQEVMNAAAYLGNQIAENNRMINQTVTALADYTEKMIKKERKKRVNQIVAVCDDQNFVIIDSYNDGSKTARKLFENLKGPLKIYRIELEDYAISNDHFFLDFSNHQIGILGEIPKLNARYLLDKFIKSGVCFRHDVSESESGKLLYRFLAPQIEQAESTLKCPALAGWKRGNFNCKENFGMSQFFELRNIPVMKKSFIKMDEITYEDCTLYFKALNKIKDFSGRVVVSIYPFLSILASVFSEELNEIAFAINLVCENSKLSKRYLCNLLQIFNRQQYEVMLLPYKKLEAIESLMGEYRDEIFFTDARFAEGTSYESKKKRQQMQRILDIAINGETNQGQKKPECGVVLFSDSYFANKQIKNFFIEFDEDKMKETFWMMRENSVMEKIFTNFVEYVHGSMDEVKRYIAESRNTESEVQNNIVAITKILQDFWDSLGINFETQLQLTHKDIFDVFLEEIVENQDDLVNEFIKIVRRNAESFVFIEKGQKEESKNEQKVLFTDEYFWFPSRSINLLLEQNGLATYKLQILTMLRENQYLITDVGEGFTRKLQVQKKRCEYYQFQKKLFNSAGRIPLESIGGEEHVER